MTTVLLVTVDLGGNVPPAIGIAAELRRRGHRVVVHGDEAVRMRAVGAGCEFALADGVAYDPLVPRSAPRTLREITRLFADRTRGRSAIAAARAVGADAVLVDALLLGAAAEVEAAGPPTALLAHSTWSYFSKAFHRGPLRIALGWRGVVPEAVVAGADRVLVVSDPRLDTAPLPPNAVRTGAVLQDPSTEPRRTDPPTVLLSLSTISYPGMRAALQRVLDALGDLPVQVEVTTGPTIRGSALRVPANATVHEFADHGALLARASVLVGHGGHATTVRALAHGVPVLVLPMHPMLDQPIVGREVAASGAGLAAPKSASPERIRAAVTRLLGEPAFGAAARTIGTAMVARDGAAVAADELERLAGQSRPVRLQASSDSPPPLSSSK
ncbi:MAG TPA: nucleotide disphospho-sugar-binding domain-containing protein [Amnibacterium sp.]